MMNVGKMPVGRTASRLARVVVRKSEPTLQRGVLASTRNVLSTRAALNVSQTVTRLPVVKVPFRQLAAPGQVTPEMKEVEQATINWRDTVTSNTEDAPKKTAALYADDCMFWGTVSEQCRQTPEHVYDYFDFFARLPKLSMVAYDPEPVRIHGNCAVHAGAYTFSWLGADGAPVETRARFTFTYRKDPDGWIIVDHHSSKMPEAPPGLKPAK